MEHLTSLPEYLNSIIKTTDYSAVTEDKINFHWGDQSELNRYLSVDQDDKMGMLLMSGTVETQFPLVWLVAGYEFSPYDNSEDLFEFAPVRLVILKRSKEEWLNTTRWKDTIHELYGIGSLLKASISSDIVGNDYSWKEEPGFHITSEKEKQSSIVHYCDALVLKINKLRIDTNCFRYLEQSC